jgi:hypothetical protein
MGGIIEACPFQNTEVAFHSDLNCLNISFLSATHPALNAR